MTSRLILHWESCVGVRNGVVPSFHGNKVKKIGITKQLGRPALNPSREVLE